jgi:hypothetical protein
MLVSVISSCSHAGSHPRLGERAIEVRDHPRIPQLPGGEVHAHDDAAQARVAPRARLPARRIEHPVAHRVPESAFLGERHEALRQHQAAVRIVPAQQRLGPAHFSRIRIDDGLVMERQLVRA